MHIKSNDDAKFYDGIPLTNWTGVVTITTNGVTTTFDVGTEVPLVGDDLIEITYTGSQTVVGISSNSFTYAFADPSVASNYIVTWEEGKLEVIHREEEVERDSSIVVPEEAKKTIEESDKWVTEVLGELTAQDQTESGQDYVKYVLTITPKEKLTDETRTTAETADKDAQEQEKLVDATEHKYVDIVLERTYSQDEADQRSGWDNYHRDSWDSLDDADAHERNKIIAVTMPFDLPEGMVLVGVTRSCHPEDGAEDHHLLTAVPKVPIGQDPTVEGFWYDPETKTIVLYARDFCVFGFHMKPAEVLPPETKPESKKCSCESDCAFAYRIKLSGKTVTGRSLGSGCSKACWAKPTSMRVAGYLYGMSKADECGGCSCLDSESLVENYHFWDGNKNEVTFDTVEMPVYEILRNGGAKNKAQIAITLGDLRLVGFGEFNPKTGRLKSASGFFAGVMPGPACGESWNSATGQCEEGAAAMVFSPCGLSAGECEFGVAFGRWSLTWRQDKVGQIEKSGSLNCLYPTGFKPAKD